MQLMKTVNVHEAKTNLSKLLKQVAAGEEVVIARDGKPVARLLPIVERPPRRILGIDKGRYAIPEDFNDPLPDEILSSFYK